MIIGITGTLGAGKGTIVAYLEQQGFLHLSVRQYLTEEIQKRAMPLDRDSMVAVANELRAANGASYIIERLYEQAASGDKDAVIESLRVPAEVAALREKDRFLLLAVDADRRKRFDRIRLRGSETDDIPFEQFVADEEREMASEDPNKQNIRGCIAMADVVIRNDGTIDDLYEEVGDVLMRWQR